LRKILVLIDEANLTSSMRQYGRRLEWNTYQKFMDAYFQGIPIETVVYVGVPPKQMTEARERKDKFIGFLRQEMGYLVVPREGTVGNPTFGTSGYKANVDVLMAIDGMQLVRDIKPTDVVLVTCDNDFAYMAIALRHLGIYVWVAGIPTYIGYELRASCNRVLSLDVMSNKLELFVHYTARYDNSEIEATGEK
jgi:uncharacterized LabA/DUF88 family protein